VIKTYQFGKFERLRFGDILRGYPSIIPTIEGPFLNNISNHKIDYNIESYLVIMVPCCAIERNYLSLTLLREIDSRIFFTPFLAEDVTRINEIQRPENCAHPTTWNEYTDEEKINCMADNPRHPYNSYFIYEPIPGFEEYPIKVSNWVLKKDDETQLSYYHLEKDKLTYHTRQYMIDFKKIFHINCEKIKRQGTPVDEEILASKIAELKPKAREKLREKIASYFGDPAPEDKPYL